MDDNFNTVKDFILDLGYTVSSESVEDHVLIINDETAGIKNCVISCADPILIMEQFILELNGNTEGVFHQLLIKNRDIIHGAFVLDETGRRVIFRDTLQIANIDINELEGSLNSLSLLLTEYSAELIKFSKN